MKLHEQFAKTRAALLEHGWCQEWYSNEDGNLCATGAMKAATTSYDAVIKQFGAAPGAVERPEKPLTIHIENSWDMERFLMANFPEVDENVRNWNDDPSRTFNDVIDLLERAELLAKEQDV